MTKYFCHFIKESSLFHIQTKICCLISYTNKNMLLIVINTRPIIYISSYPSSSISVYCISSINPSIYFSYRLLFGLLVLRALVYLCVLSIYISIYPSIGLLYLFYPSIGLLYLFYPSIYFSCRVLVCLLVFREQVYMCVLSIFIYMCLSIHLSAYYIYSIFLFILVFEFLQVSWYSANRSISVSYPSLYTSIYLSIYRFIYLFNISIYFSCRVLVGLLVLRALVYICALSIYPSIGLLYLFQPSIYFSYRFLVCLLVFREQVYMCVLSIFIYMCLSIHLSAYYIYSIFLFILAVEFFSVSGTPRLGLY